MGRERIDQTFADKKAHGESVFIAYITAGDPTIDATVRLVHELEENGVGLIELGVPFSDPIADGPVNQDAAQRALEHGINLAQILDAVKTVRERSQIPIIFFTYYNMVLQYGLDRFAIDCRNAGVDGALILDLPPEEAGEYRKVMEEVELATIFLVSPVTPPDRIELIAQNATGFVYYVSQLGVTGERSEVATATPRMIAKIREFTDVPVAVGFGISTPDHVREVAGYADGLIVGSAIVKRIGELGSTPDFEKEIGAFVHTLTAPLKGQ